MAPAANCGGDHHAPIPPSGGNGHAAVDRGQIQQTLRRAGYPLRVASAPHCHRDDPAKDGPVHQKTSRRDRRLVGSGGIRPGQGVLCLAESTDWLCFTGSERGTSRPCPACGPHSATAVGTMRCADFGGYRALVGSVNMPLSALGQRSRSSGFARPPVCDLVREPPGRRRPLAVRPCDVGDAHTTPGSPRRKPRARGRQRWGCLGGTRRTPQSAGLGERTGQAGAVRQEPIPCQQKGTHDEIGSSGPSRGGPIGRFCNRARTLF